MWRNLFENNRSKIKKLILKKRENRKIPTLPRWDFLNMKAVLIYVSFEHKQIFGKKSVFVGAVSPVKGITRLIKCGEIFSKNNRSKIKKLILKKRENREIPTLPRWDFLNMKAVLIYVSFEHKQIFGKKIRFRRCSFPRKGNHTSDKMWRNLFENNRSKIKKTYLKEKRKSRNPHFASLRCFKYESSVNLCIFWA